MIFIHFRSSIVIHGNDNLNDLIFLYKPILFLERLT